MKNIKSKLIGFVAVTVVALSLPATGHSQMLYNGYFNIDWQYNWPLGDSYADKSSGWGMNFEGGYYFPSNVGLPHKQAQSEDPERAVFAVSRSMRRNK